MGVAVAGEPWLSGSMERWWRVGERREAPPARSRLLDQVRAALRMRHYSCRTEGAYAGWIRRYIAFRGKRHPACSSAAPTG